MVLKTNAGSVPKFEDVGDDEFDTPAAEAPAAAPAETPAPQPATATVMALPAVTTPSRGLTKPAPINMADYDVLAMLKDRLPPVEFGEGLRLVGSNGNVLDSDKKPLGDRIVMQVLSWNQRWVISPGTKGEENKEKARYSWDGVTTTRDENVAEYVQQLKDDGFNKAACKEYIDVFGLLLSASKDERHVNKTATLSLSPDSVKAFNGLRRDLVVQGMMKRSPVCDPSMGVTLEIECEIKSGGGNSWTRLVPTLVVDETSKKAA